MIRFILTSVAALAVVAQFASAQLAVTPLTVKTDEATHAFTVEIADTEEAIREGLILYDVACSACHSLGTVSDHRVGPPLGGLLNRQAGELDGYQFSEALRTSGWIWRLPTLLAWLTDPDAAIPNNAMNYVNPLTAEETQQLSEWLLRQP